MLNVFPELLQYSAFGAMIIRLILAFILLLIGWHTLTRKKVSFSAYFEAKEYPMARFIPTMLGIAQIVTGLFLFFGFFTQIAALVALYLFFTLLYIENRTEKILLSFTPTFFIVMIILTITLLLTGAGPFAVDLPL